MSPFRRLLTTVVVCLCCLLIASSAAARVWTDKQGRTINAKFVRVVGAVGVFQLANGKIVQVPLANLSQPDQKHLKELLAAQGVRTWTDTQGRQILAKFLRVKDGTVFVKPDRKTVPLPFADLSIADRLWVRGKAKEKGQADELPRPTPDEELPEKRTWTDTGGVSDEGRLDRVLSDGRVLLAVEGATRVVDIKRLTPADHDYLREKLKPQGLAHLVPRKPEPPRPPVSPVRPSTRHPPSRIPSTRNPTRPRVPVRPPPVTRYTPPRAPSSPPSGRMTNRVRTPQPYSPPRVEFTPVTPVQILKCSKCGKTAPPGAKLGQPCTYCSKRISPYGLGRAVGMVGGVLALIALVGGLIWRQLSG